MSYRRNYTGYVHYSGSVSYPASQNGGSVNYSGSEPIYITIDVDTKDFDNSISNCNNTINGLTTAIVATEIAQVESKRASSKKIADNIIKGFFDYVGADLSQKIKELVSKCESLFVALISHKESCHSKTTQMQEDYNRISKRYSKIFEDLDKETISRIESIDKPTFQFADNVQNAIDKNTNSELIGISTISANENIRLETLLSCSHIKQQANKLLTKVNNYLRSNYNLTNMVKNILDEPKIECDIFIPIIFVEFSTSSNCKDYKIYSAAENYTSLQETFTQQLFSIFLSEDIKWHDTNINYSNNINSYINTYTQSEQIEKRILNTMLGMLNNNQVIKKIKYNERIK